MCLSPKRGELFVINKIFFVFRGKWDDKNKDKACKSKLKENMRCIFIIIFSDINI